MTFSIVARCAETGRLGVAVASASLAVGARCAFAEGGIGAVATQNRTQPSIGPAALKLLRAGLTAQQAAERAAHEFPFPEWRQVAVVDQSGHTGVFNGARCSGLHGAVQGEGAIALGNLLAAQEVPAAMMERFHSSDGALEDRLLAALEAGLSAGGETRPIRSAALKVVDRDPFAFTDLRIDWDAAPLERLSAVLEEWRPVAETCRKWAVDPGGV